MTLERTLESDTRENTKENTRENARDNTREKIREKIRENIREISWAHSKIAQGTVDMQTHNFYHGHSLIALIWFPSNLVIGFLLIWLK